LARAEESWLELRGARVLVRETGSGAPVLLINGLGSDTALWGPLEQAWPDVRLISFDAPGIGRSPGSLRPTSILRLAQIAEALLDRLGLDQVDVVGYSLGGTVAQTLARTAPRRVRRLVLVATAPGWGCVPGRWRSVAPLYNPLRYFSRSYYERTLGGMAGGQALNPAFVARHAAERMSHRPRLITYYSQLAAASCWSSLPWLHEVSAPALVVAGGDDRLLPVANSVLMARRLQQARLQVHPQEGHLLLFDGDSPALPAIHEFLTAATLGQSRTWRRADVVTARDEERAVRSARGGMFPWGLAHAAYRASRGRQVRALKVSARGLRQRRNM
jgi:pimeloyl-ACP methyl ester carboxylesterase